MRKNAKPASNHIGHKLILTAKKASCPHHHTQSRGILFAKHLTNEVILLNTGSAFLAFHRNWEKTCLLHYVNSSSVADQLHKHEADRCLYCLFLFHNPTCKKLSGNTHNYICSKITDCILTKHTLTWGVRWCSDRASDSEWIGPGFDPHWRHHVVHDMLTPQSTC